MSTDALVDSKGSCCVVPDVAIDDTAAHGTVEEETCPLVTDADEVCGIITSSQSDSSISMLSAGSDKSVLSGYWFLEAWFLEDDDPSVSMPKSMPSKSSKSKWKSKSSEADGGGVSPSPDRARDGEFRSAGVPPLVASDDGGGVGNDGVHARSPLMSVMGVPGVVGVGGSWAALGGSSVDRLKS